MGFLVNEQRVIRLLVRKRLAARFTAMTAGLNVPLGNQSRENIARGSAELQPLFR